MSSKNLISLPAIFIPVLLFIVFDSVALGLNFWISAKLEKSAVAINLSGRQRMLSQRMTKSFLMLHVANEDSEKQTAFNEFAGTVELFDNTLKGFISGGMTRGGDGNPLYLPAADAQNAALITASAHQLWSKMYSQLRPVISAGIHVDDQALHTALYTLLDDNQALLTLMNDLTSVLEQNATLEVSYLRFLQVSLLLLALLNFALVCKRLLRQINQSHANVQSLRNIIDSIETGILLYDNDDVVRSANKAAEQLFGYGQGSLIGKPLNQLLSADQERTLGLKSDQSCFIAQINRQTLFELGDEISLCTVIDVSEQTHKEKQLMQLAFHDPLTGLPNRILLMERLRQDLLRAKRDSTLLAVMFVDLDGFKAVNDELGHDVGDELLQAIAKRFQQCCREVDTVARLGGDEFIFILSAFHTKNAANLVAGNIIHATNQVFPIQDHRVQLSASLGIAFYPHDHGEAERLIKLADDAMYLAKQRGKNNFAFASELA